MKMEKKRIADRIANRMGDAVAEFERNTGIYGLKFQMDASTHYYVARVPEEMVGVLKNNFKEVKIFIRTFVIEDGAKLLIYADFRYIHRDGGSNGVSVMDADGERVFRAELDL